MPTANISNPNTHSFAKIISSTHDPEVVPVIYWDEAIQGECFYNCRKFVAEKGGNIVFGWAIWDYFGLFLQAEHHSVARRKKSLYCVSPQGQDRHLVFIRDHSARFDFSNRGSVLPGSYQQTADCPHVEKYLRARVDFDKAKIRLNGSPDDEDALREAVAAQSLHQHCKSTMDLAHGLDPQTLAWKAFLSGR